jgi:hypothetical protein
MQLTKDTTVNNWQTPPVDELQIESVVASVPGIPVHAD